MTLRKVSDNFQSAGLGHECSYIGLKRLIAYENGTFTRNVSSYFNAINLTLSFPKF